MHRKRFTHPPRMQNTYKYFSNARMCEEVRISPMSLHASEHQREVDMNECTAECGEEEKNTHTSEYVYFEQRFLLYGTVAVAAVVRRVQRVIHILLVPSWQTSAMPIRFSLSPSDFASSLSLIFVRPLRQ